MRGASKTCWRTCGSTIIDAPLREPPLDVAGQVVEVVQMLGKQVDHMLAAESGLAPSEGVRIDAPGGEASAEFGRQHLRRHETLYGRWVGGGVPVGGGTDPARQLEDASRVELQAALDRAAATAVEQQLPRRRVGVPAQCCRRLAQREEVAVGVHAGDSTACRHRSVFVWRGRRRDLESPVAVVRGGSRCCDSRRKPTTRSSH